MRALKRVRVRFLGKEASCTALFDTGSGVTVIQRKFFEENFGAAWSTLEKPLKLYWISGELVQADKHAQLMIAGRRIPPPRNRVRRRRVR